jgi:hypothetical protein
VCAIYFLITESQYRLYFTTIVLSRLSAFCHLRKSKTDIYTQNKAQ